jgi:hypothetical protein
MGTTDHNRPLYITGDCEEQKIGCILVDVGSSINIMPLKILKKIALDVKTYLMRRYPRVLSKLSEDLGAVTLNLQHGGLESPMKFYVINAETSYRALLG